MARIEFLPEHLRDVPDLRFRGDEEMRERWFSWKDALLAYREVIHRNCTDQDFREDILRMCAADPAYALILFGAVHEPRTRGGRGGVHPFVPFGWQVELIRWFEYHMNEELSDGFISKARGLGATWVFCWLSVHGWLFNYPFDPMLVSRNAELVDKTSDKKSMFWRILFFIQNMPTWMLPQGFNLEEHKTRMVLLNPENGNSILGDATTAKASRGGRATFMLYDEAAFIYDFEDVWDTGDGTTDHRFAISTESMDAGGDFHRLWTQSKNTDPKSVLELDWWRNPYFDEEWHTIARGRAEKAGKGHVFEREYGRNMMAGVGGYIYEYARSISPKVVDYIPGGGRQLYCCIDPGVRDESAYWWVQYDPGTGEYDVIECYMRANADIRYHASIMLGIPLSGSFDYDGDAMEVMAWTRTIRDPIIYVGDPYGENRGGDGSTTWYSSLQEKSAEISGGMQGIYVMTSWEKIDRGFRDGGRHDALREILPKANFNDNPRVRRGLSAIQEHRYKDMDDSRETTSVTKTPVHNAGSHLVTALEYLAVHRRVSIASTNMKRQKASRAKVGGAQFSSTRR